MKNMDGLYPFHTHFKEVIMKQNKLTRAFALMLALLLCLSAVDTGFVRVRADELVQAEEPTEEAVEAVAEPEAAAEPEELPEEVPAEAEKTEEAEEAEAEEEAEEEEEHTLVLGEEALTAAPMEDGTLVVPVTRGQIRKSDLVKAIRSAYGPSTATRYYISTKADATTGELTVFANLVSEKITLNPGTYYAYTKAAIFSGKAKLIGSFTVVETVILPAAEITLKTKLSTVTIPYSADGAVNTALLEQLLFDALYESSTPELTVDDVQITVDGESLESVTPGTHTVKLTFLGNSEYGEGSAATDVKFNEASKPQIVLKEGVSIPYSQDVDAMRKAIFEKVIDWSVSSLPKGVTMDDLVFEYKPSSELLKLLGLNVSSILWYNIEGTALVPHMGAGTQTIRVRADNALAYLTTSGTTVEVKKAKLSVKVNSTSIYANESLPAGLVTVTPNDPDIKTLTVFTGATSDISLAVFVDLPAKALADSSLIRAIDPIVKRIVGISFVEAVKTGITVGQLRALVDSEELMDILDLLGYDSSALRSVLKLLDSLSGLTDNIRITLNSPNRAGLYNVTCYASSSNYVSAVGMGTLTVKVVTKGVSLVWDSDFPSSIKVSELPGFTYGATVMVNGEKAPFQDNISIKFTGITSKLRIYSSSKMPTEPGSYRVTVSTSGGSYKASNLTKSFRIVKG